MNRLRMFLLVACCTAIQANEGRGNSVDIPPVDCTKPADPLDTEICADKAMKEWWFEVLFRDALELHPERRDAIHAAQQEWLTLRDACADPDLTLDCVYALYDEQIGALIDESIQPHWLRSAADPARALADFRPLSSPLAKMYADLLSHALSAESIAAFATFAEGLSSRFDDEVWRNGPRVVLPCSLVERYPRLLLLTRPDFDGARDTSRWRPNLDCGINAGSLEDLVQYSLPDETEQFLDANPRALENWFERCGGENTTYRPWAEYSHVVHDRMRHFPRSYLTGQLTTTSAPEKPWPMPQEIEAWYSDPGYRVSQRALGEYYRAKFRLAREEAETAASRALWDSRNTMDQPAVCLDAP